MSRQFLACASLMLLVLVSVSPAHAVPQEVNSFLTRIGNEALTVVKDEKMSDAEKQRKLEVLFANSVDIDWIARFVLGRYARTVNPAEMERYKKEYKAFLLKFYTSRFTEYTGETFRINGGRDEGDNEYLMNMEILRPNSQPSVFVDYKVRKEGNEFVIFDIIVEGVSLITTQRSEFSSVISRQGIDALINQIAAKNAALPKGALPSKNL